MYGWLQGFASSRVGRARTLKTLSVDQVLLTGQWQSGVRQRGDQTRLAKVRPHIAAEHRAKEALQRQDVSSRRRPGRQKVLEHVMKCVWSR